MGTLRTIITLAATSLLFAAAAQTPVPPATPPDVAALITECIASAQANADEAYRYNFTEDWSTVSNSPASITNTMLSGNTSSNTGDISGRTNHRDDSGGQSQQVHPTSVFISYDVTFIDGFPFRRMLSYNHIDLSPAQAAAEQARYDREYERIRALTPAQRLASLEDRHAMIFDPHQLLSHYACRLNGHATVNHQSTIVVDCVYLNTTGGVTTIVTKKSRHTKAPPPIKNALPSAVTFYIDPQHKFFVRTRMVLSQDMGDYGKNSSVTNDWTLIKGVWHQTATHIEYTSSKNGIGTGEIYDNFSNFRRFSTDVTFFTPAKNTNNAATGAAPTTFTGQHPPQ